MKSIPQFILEITCKCTHLKWVKNFDVRSQKQFKAKSLFKCERCNRSYYGQAFVRFDAHMISVKTIIKGQEITYLNPVKP